jgi:hypothetical protein
MTAFVRLAAVSFDMIDVTWNFTTPRPSCCDSPIFRLTGELSGRRTARTARIRSRESRAVAPAPNQASLPTPATASERERSGAFQGFGARSPRWYCSL